MTFDRILKKLFTIVRLAIAVGLLVYLGRSGFLDWTALQGLFVAWPITTLAVALFLVDIVVTASRVCVLMAPRGLYLSLGASVRLAFIGLFFNVCLPGSAGGDALRIYYASKGNEGRRTEVATIFVFDRLIGLFAMLLWPLLAAPFFLSLATGNAVLRGLLGAAALAVLVVTALFVIAGSRRVRGSAPVAAALTRLPGGSYLRTVLDTVATFRGTPLTLGLAFGISLLAHTIAIAIMLLVAQATNPAGAEWKMSLLIPLGFIANTLPLTPGGLGVGEAAFERLFAMVGLAGGAETMLGWRLLTVVVGLLGLVFFLQGGRRFVQHASAATSLPIPERSLSR